MREHAVTTNIDGKPFEWSVAGEFAWGAGPPLYAAEHDQLSPIIGEGGYSIFALPDGLADSAHHAIEQFLDGYGLSMCEYHAQVSDDQHQSVISKSRTLSMAELGWGDGSDICNALSSACGVDLIPNMDEISKGNIIVRINRPGSTDFNPPHRDGTLDIWRNTVNFWVPISGCNADSRLTIVPGSHLTAEADCWQTAPGGAWIARRQYHVPAIVRTVAGNLDMIRTTADFGQALLFTPYLLHGLAVNNSSETRISLELRLTVKGQEYPARSAAT